MNVVVIILFKSVRSHQWCVLLNSIITRTISLNYHHFYLMIKSYSKLVRTKKATIHLNWNIKWKYYKVLLYITILVSSNISWLLWAKQRNQTHGWNHVCFFWKSSSFWFWSLKDSGSPVPWVRNDLFKVILKQYWSLYIAFIACRKIICWNIHQLL